MRVLLDENLPRGLTELLVGFQVDTVVGRGWGGVENGQLLKRAADGYDAFLTMDRKLPAQQSIAGLPFGVVLLLAPSNRLRHLRPLMPELLRILPSVKPGALYTVTA